MKNKRIVIGQRCEVVSGNYWRRREGGSVEDGGVMDNCVRENGDDSEEKNLIGN